MLILFYLTSTEDMKEQESCSISLRYLASPLDPNSSEVIRAQSPRSGQQTLSSLDNKTKHRKLQLGSEWFFDKKEDM